MRKTLFILIALSLLAACKTSKGPKAPPPSEVAASALADQLGDSLETAVSVPASAASDEGALFENRWIYDRYGKFRRQFSGIVSDNGRHYDEIRVELFDHTFKTVYFDITEVYGASLGHNAR